MKNYLDGIIGGAISGVVLLVATIIAASYGAGLGSEPWLNFAGVIVGVVLTIGGTFIIANWLDKRRVRMAVQRLEAAVAEWCHFTEGLKINSDIQHIGKLKGRYAFIVKLSNDVDAALIELRLACHTFELEAPKLIDRLRNSIVYAQNGYEQSINALVRAGEALKVAAAENGK